MIRQKTLQKTADLIGFDYDAENDVMISRKTPLKVKDIYKAIKEYGIKFYGSYTLQDFLYQVIDGFGFAPTLNGEMDFIMKDEEDGYRKLYILVR